jgi:hypothetical protein
MRPLSVLFKTKDELQFKSFKQLREMVQKISIVSNFKVRWDLPMFSTLGEHIAHYKDVYKDPTTKFIPFYPLW